MRQKNFPWKYPVLSQVDLWFCGLMSGSDRRFNMQSPGLKRLRSLKSHPTDWESQRSNLGPLVQSDYSFRYQHVESLGP